MNQGKLDQGPRLILVDYVMNSKSVGGTALRLAMGELGKVDIVAPGVRDLSGVLTRDAALVVVYMASTDQFFEDLPLLAQRVRRDALVLVFSFVDREYEAVAVKLQTAIGTEMPNFVTKKKNRSAMKGAIWFRQGTAEIQPLTAQEWSLTGMLGRARDTAVAKLLLYPAVAQSGLAWAALPKPKLAWWSLKVYGPLALIVLGSLVSPLVRDVMQPAGERHVAARRKQLLQFEEDHYVGGIPATARELNDGQLKQLADLQVKIYAVTTSETACAGLASGSDSARDQAVAKLTLEEIDSYFQLLQQAFIQPTRDFADFNPEYMAATMRISRTMRPEDASRYLDFSTRLDESPSAPDLCWFNSITVKHYVILPEKELIPVVMRVNF